MTSSSYIAVAEEDIAAHVRKTTSSIHLSSVWWLDPLAATLGFVVAIYVYTFYEIQSGKSTFSSFYDFLLGNDNTCGNISRGAGKQTKKIHHPAPSYFLLKSLFAYWAGIILWIHVVPPPAPALPIGMPDSLFATAVLFVEVVSGILLYDFYFYFIHYFLHHCKDLAYLVRHEEHHSSKTQHNVVEARHVLQHSFLDGLLQVFVNIAVQRHTPWGSVKSRIARVLHNMIVTWMLTESHSSSDYPNVFRRFSICKGVKEHRRHHLMLFHHYHHHHRSRRTDKKEDDTTWDHDRYQQFFGYLDDWRVADRLEKVCIFPKFHRNS